MTDGELIQASLHWDISTKTCQNFYKPCDFQRSNKSWMKQQIPEGEKWKVFIEASDLEISTPHSYLEGQRQNIQVFLFKYGQ